MGLVTKNNGILKKSVTISGHRTSITLEPEFWDALKHIAQSQKQSLNALVTHIDEKRLSRNLSSALRVYILQNYQEKNRRK